MTLPEAPDSVVTTMSYADGALGASAHVTNWRGALWQAKKGASEVGNDHQSPRCCINRQALSFDIRILNLRTQISHRPHA